MPTPDLALDTTVHLPEVERVLHFTTAFGRCFGIPPSIARSRLAAPEPRRRLEARLGRADAQR
jgi:hypothetical protein